MLVIKIPASEYYNNETNEFVNMPEYTLHMEHSLVSISKWEAEFEKPFLDETTERTTEETLSYIKYMTLEQNIPDIVYKTLSTENLKKINAYIEKKMTATWFREDNNKKPSKNRGPFKRGEVITSELIYFWMIELNVPVDFQKWHINRLLTLIRVCNEKHKEANGDNKMSKKDIIARNKKLNAQRRAKMKTRG